MPRRAAAKAHPEKLPWFTTKAACLFRADSMPRIFILSSLTLASGVNIPARRQSADILHELHPLHIRTSHLSSTHNNSRLERVDDERCAESNRIWHHLYLPHSSATHPLVHDDSVLLSTPASHAPSFPGTLIGVTPKHDSRGGQTICAMEREARSGRGRSGWSKHQKSSYSGGNIPLESVCLPSSHM